MTRPPPPPPPDTNHSAAEVPGGDPLAAVRAIFERYRGDIEAQVDRVEAVAVALLEDNLDESARREAERDAHKLAGSLGTFGFAPGSKIAREIEFLLQGTDALTRHDTLRLSELVVALREVIDSDGKEASAPSGSSQAEASEGRQTGTVKVLVIDEDSDLVTRLTMELASRGAHVMAASDAESARSRLDAEPPDAVMLDLGMGTGHDMGLLLLGEIAARYQGLPIVVLTERDSFIDRVEVARRGGRGFIQKPQTPSLIADVIWAAIESSKRGIPTILTVDDDPLITEAIRSLLEPQGMRVVSANVASATWELLEEHDPDLVILDIDMPKVSGIEICRTMRSDQRWAATPVVFLTARVDAETVVDVFGAGADDFVPKPLIPAEFLARVLGRLERVELLRSIAESDLLTRVDTRRAATERITRLLNLARRHSQPVAIGTIDIDGLRKVNEEHGHSMGDRILRRFGELANKHLDGDDVVGRWGGEEFVVAMYGMTRQDGVQRLAALLDDFRADDFGASPADSLAVTFSGGVAVFPDDGITIDDLSRASSSALGLAKSQGRDRVLPAGWDPAGELTQQTNVDIVVIEDDPPVAELLLHTLNTRGFKTFWVNDGNEAIEMLVGEPPRLACKVVLLDVDLPGLDGLSILQGLAKGGILNRTKVIMLTVRAAEAEVLRAMELGAFDHVPKPFSTPVLVQRVRRALET